MKALKCVYIMVFMLSVCCNSITDLDDHQGWSLQHRAGDHVNWYSLSFPDEMNGWIVGSSGSIKHTTDGGKTWDMQQSGTNADLWKVCFIDQNNGWACGKNNTLLRTTDRGSNWVSLSPTDEADVLFTDMCFSGPQTGWLCTNNGKILKTTDGGATWTINKIISTQYGSLMTQLNATTLYVYHGSIYRTFDGGVSWDSVNVIRSKSHRITNLFFTSKNDGYLSVENGSGGSIITEFPVITTRDSGKTWNGSTLLTGTGFRCIWFTDANNGWIAGNDNIYRTSDSGKNWSLDFSDSDHLYSRDICFVNTVCGWLLCRDGKIFKYVAD